jgi:hypothetical protein
LAPASQVENQAAAAMRVSDSEVIDRGDACELRAWVAGDASPDDADWFEPASLWFRFPRWCLPYLSAGNGDPFLAALLVPAMHLGEPLAISAPVSPRLLAAVPTLQDIYVAFDHRVRRIPVLATARDEVAPSARSDAAGLFFSLGVDSFYSLIKHWRRLTPNARTLTHLITIDGFDVGRGEEDAPFPAAIRANALRVAGETGATWVPVVTNLRRFGAPLAPFTLMHGAALASVALALGELLGSVTIAASLTYDELYPWGSHPVLDPLWSTERLTVIHDGCERDTIDKTAIISAFPLVLDTLRVCPGYSARYNCGRCLKCVRTMIDLLVVGKLLPCRTFPHTIDPDDLRAVLPLGSGPIHLAAFRRRLASLQALGTAPDLQRELEAYFRSLEQSPGSPRRARWRRVRQFVRLRQR